MKSPNFLSNIIITTGFFGYKIVYLYNYKIVVIQIYSFWPKKAATFFVIQHLIMMKWVFLQTDVRCKQLWHTVILRCNDETIPKLLKLSSAGCWKVVMRSDWVIPAGLSQLPGEGVDTHVGAKRFKLLRLLTSDN